MELKEGTEGRSRRKVGRKVGRKEGHHYVGGHL
jgi:hypothetical protein